MRRCNRCNKVTRTKYCDSCMKVKQEEDRAWAEHEMELRSERIRKRMGRESSQTVPASVASKERSGPQLWTAEDLADYLRVPVTWVKSKARENIIPHIKVGRRYSFDPNSPEFKAWIDSLKVPRKK